MKVALLFPGYGSQYVGMGKELYDEYRIVQEYFEEASNCLDINFVKLCFASSDVELSKFLNAYTSLFLIGCSVFALLKEIGINADVVAGYNNGEYASLFAGGCFSLPDGLYLLNKFASFYQEFLDTVKVDVMHITGVSTKDLEYACTQVSGDTGKASIAIYNSSDDHFVAGNIDQLDQLRRFVDDKSGVIVEYSSPEVGLHSPLMNSVVDQFKMYLEKVDFKDVQIPFISSIDGAIITQGTEIKDRFIRHINSAIKFNDVVIALNDYDYIIIAGPGDQLRKIIKEQYPEKRIMSVVKKADIESLKELITIELNI